ncbi:MAG: UDP-N-acetylmuramate dehydrogenase [Gammaproteobacteria bacterium]|nr:MAG: UDP-N-acetylmuramate dehydrogenase [Gammaproteobacteria bacterium]
MAAGIQQDWQGEFRYDEPMAAHSSWHTGGSARYFYQPESIDDLCAFLRGLDTDEQLLWLGLGSNLLVRDGGFSGTVIYTFGALSMTEWLADDILRAGCGVTCSKVARLTAKAGFTGVEFLAGIPGTMGGALAMNAGAFGGETWSHVAAVETVDRQGVLHTRPPEDYRIGYRRVTGPANEWFVAAHLRLEQGDVQAAQDNIRKLLARRNATQPTQQYSCGSVFRNPPGDHAARLIEAAGLKGATVGGAKVSEKHANFIINTGSATAADIETLINQVQGTVEQLYSIRLEPEVRIVGDQPAGLGHG